MRWIVVVLALAACGSKNTPPPAPQVPAGVLATVSRSSVDWMDNARAFANAMRSGAGLMLSDDLIMSAGPRVLGVKSMDGVDRREALHVVVVDRGKGDGLEFALVTHVADKVGLEDAKGNAGLLIQGDWAIVGPKPVVDLVGTWALAKLVPPGKPGLTATIYPIEVMKVYGQHLDRFRKAAVTEFSGGNPALQRVLELYGNGVMALANDAQQIDLAIDPSADVLSVDLAITPKAGSELATFAGAQEPSDFAMIDKLPAMPPPPLLVAGRLALGPYRDGFRGVLQVLFASMASAPDINAALDGVMGAATGAFAVLWRLDGGGAVLTQVLGLDDPAAAGAAIDKGLAAAQAGIHDAGPLHLEITAVPPGDHDNIPVRGYQMSADKAAQPAKVLLATVDKTLVIVSGPQAEERAGMTIDAVRARGAHFLVPPAWSRMLETARKDKDSVALVLDLARFGPIANDSPGIPLLVGIGFDASAMRVHLAIPPAAMATFLP